MRIDEATPSAAGIGRPSRYADPRALSQAWYDALYPNRARAARSEPAARATPAVVTEATTQSATPAQSSSSRTTFAVPRTPLGYDGRPNPATASLGTDASVANRHASRRLVSSNAAAAQRRDGPMLRVELEQPGGPPLRLLLQTAATGVHVVAVCSAAQRDRIEGALHRTRAALAARGFSFDYEVHDA